MTRIHQMFGTVFAAGALVSACVGAEKSSNPLSPAVAGPIAGVEITAPGLLEPSQGSRLKESQQPIRLMVENASSSGVRPLYYTFEVASDTGFETKLYARTKVAPGDGGRTSVVIDRLDLDRVYYWRARAEDGANTGPFTQAQFEVLPKPFVSAPVPLSPVNHETVGSPRPPLRVRNAERNSAVGPLVYQFQVSGNQAFTDLTANFQAEEASGETVGTVPTDLPSSATQYWRARALDSETQGDWGVVQVFQTPNISPAPPPAPSPGGGGGGSCALGNGPAIVSCISAKYADKRAPVSSLAQRRANMTFLRDRIIEAGKCSGQNYGYNLKRGGPERSIDVIAWQRPDGNMGVDIGRDYDGISRTLQLVWAEVDLFAVFEPYPSVNCNGV